MTIEVGDRTLDVHAEELHGAERDEKYAVQAARYSGFADYQAATTGSSPSWRWWADRPLRPDRIRKD